MTTSSTLGRWPHLRRDTLWWAGLAFTVLGSMFVLLVWMALEENVDFQTNGVHAVAKVTSKDEQTEIVHKVITTKYLLWYTYEAAGQSHWLGWGEVSYSRWEKAKIGDSLKIVYLRDTPRKSRLAEAADITSGKSWLWAGAAFAFVFVCAGSFLAGYAFIRSGRSLEGTSNSSPLARESP